MISASARLLLLTLFVIQGHALFAQRDTVFWFAAPDISSAVGESPVLLRFESYNQPVSITVSQPSNGSFVPLSLTLNAFTSDSLNITAFLAQIESPGADIVSNNGLKISSTGPVNVVYVINSSQNKETFSLKGNRALGTDFYTPFQKQYDNATTTPESYSGFEIVATQNATTVLITPRTAIAGHAANVTFSVTLSAGQTYSARDVSALASTSLAGSIISSNKPVAVTLFDGQLTQSSCADAIGDQLIATPSIGTDYAIYKGTSANDRVFVLATQNATALDITGSGTTSALIASGETYDFSVTDDVMHIHASKPIYVLHVSGFGCELSGAIVPSLNCKGNNQSSFSRSGSDSLGIVLITRSGFEDDFLLNGTAGVITAPQFVTVPGTSGQYKAARIFVDLATVPLNSHNTIINNGDIFTMAIMNGGDNNGASYIFTSDFYATAFSTAGVDDTVCANVQYPLSGSVGGGAIAGSWSGNGYGTFVNGLNSVPNTYEPSPLDTLISPIRLVLSTVGNCPVVRDTLYLIVTPSPIVNANTDQSICSNNAAVELAGSVSGGTTNGHWSTNGNGTFLPDSADLNAVYIPSVSDIGSGMLQFVLTSDNDLSCAVVTDTMYVTFTPAPVVNAGTDTVIVCSNNPNIPLSGSVSGPTTTGKWTTSGAGFFLPNNSSLNCTYIPDPADTVQGIITIYLQSTSNGNCNVVFDSLVAIFTDEPVIYAGANQIICSNDSDIQLAGTISGSTFGGIWTGGSGTYISSDTLLNALYQPAASEISSGSLLLTLTSTNNGNCVAVADQVLFNFTAGPVADFTSDAVCAGNSTQFTDLSVPGSGTLTAWSWDFGNGQTAANQHPANIFAVTGNAPVNLIVTNSYGCTDTVQYDAIVYDKPQANFSYILSCPDNQPIAYFTDNSTSSDELNYWYYDFGGQGTAAIPNTSNTFSAGGFYSVTHIVGTINQCKDTMVQIIAIDDLPNAGFYFNTSGETNIGAAFNFIDTSANSVSYSWNFGDGNTSTEQDPSHVYYTNGNYNIIQYVANNLGCMDSAFQFIVVNTITDKIQDLIPTVISPNNDGLNDIWKLKFIELLSSEAHITIYNEWGQLLFESIGYDTPWDGTWQSEPVPDGNYFYIIQLNTNEYPDPFKGVLTVLRKRG